MTHVARHSSTSPYSDSEYDFLFPAEGGRTPPSTGISGTGLTLQDFLFKNLQSGVSATANTLTIAATGDKITLVLDDNGNVIDTVLTRASDAVGPITALAPISLPGGWLLVPMTGGAKPVIIPPSKDRTGQFLEVPGDPSQVLAFDANGGIKLIQRNQAPIAAVEVGFEFQSDGTMRTFFADGTHRDVPAVSQFELGQIEERGGSQYVETSPGNFSRVPKNLPPGEVVNLGGRDFIRQPDGTIQPLPAEKIPPFEELIIRALQDDDVEGAIALDNFQNRPNSTEFFQAALDFAQSPGDIAAISAIARGQTLVQPGPPGSVQRIAEQPKVLQDAFARLIQDVQGGGGSPNAIASALTRASQRMVEDNEIATDAEQKLADLIAANAKDEKQDLLDRIAKLEKSVDSGPPIAETPSRPSKFDRPTPPVRRAPDQFNLDEPGQNTSPLVLPITSPTIPPVLPAPDPFNLDEPGPVPVAEVPNTVSFSSQGLIEDDLFAHGGVIDDNTAIVGEEGPELLIASPGARVIPLEGDDVAKLKKRLGVKGLAHGGPIAHAGQSANELIFAAAIAETPEEDRPFDPFNRFISPELRVGETLPQPVPINAAQQNTARQISVSQGVVDPALAALVQTSEPVELPFGVQQALRGGSIEPTRRRLSTAAGFTTLSAQTRQRLLPEELDVLDRLRAEAGIPLGAFQQEQRSAVPGTRARDSRFAARVAR